MLIATAAAVLGIVIGFARLREGSHQGHRADDPRQRLVLRPDRHRVHGRPGPRGVRGDGVVRRQRRRRRRQRRRPGRAGIAGELRKGQTGYVRIYAGDHRHRRRRAARLVRPRARDPLMGEGVFDRALGDGLPIRPARDRAGAMHRTSGDSPDGAVVHGRVPDPHRPHPRAGRRRARRRRHRQAPARARQADRPAVQRGDRRAERLAARPVRVRRRRLPVRVAAPVDRGVGHLVAPRRRRHLAVPRRAHRRAVPAGDRRRRPAPRREAVPRLAAAARGRRDGQLPQPRPVRVLHLLRDRARADVLPHRRVGLRRPRLRGDEVLPVHDVRLGVHARRHHRHGLPRPRQHRRTSRSTSTTSPSTPTSPRRRRAGCSSPSPSRSP